MHRPPFDAKNQVALAKKISLGKFERIPVQYSDTLFQVISWMLQRDRSRRPRVEDLERLPQFATHLREHSHTVSDFKLNSLYSARVKELRAREERLRRHESALIKREVKLERTSYHPGRD